MHKPKRIWTFLVELLVPIQQILQVFLKEKRFSGYVSPSACPITKLSS